MTAAPARSVGLPQWLAARRGKAMRGLDMRFSMREAEDSGVSWCKGLGTAGRKSWGETISNGMGAAIGRVTMRDGSRQDV